jgi:hypothetical protein
MDLSPITPAHSRSISHPPLGVTGLKTRLGERVFKGMDVSRKTLMSHVQASSDDIVCWIDCGFYLMPVTSSKLSRFGLSNVKFVNPLASNLTVHDPVFEYVGSLKKFDKLEKAVEKAVENQIEDYYPMKNSNRFSCSYSKIFRIFLSAFM